MLKHNIKKIETLDSGYFTTTFKVTAENGESDEISVDTSFNSLLVHLNDTSASSYKLYGNRLSTTVEKTKGALAGGVFELRDGGAYFFSESMKANSEIYYNGNRNVFAVCIEKFQINIILRKNVYEKDDITIVLRKK